MRDSFIFYRSFYEAIKDLPRDIQSEVYSAIMEYSLNGVVANDLKPVARSIFTLMKPQIDVNNKRFENGKKGGRPKREDKPTGNQNQTKEKPSNNQVDNQRITNEQPNVNDNANDNANDNEDNKLSSPLPPMGERGGDYLSSPLSKKDGIPRNYLGLCDNLKRLNISQKEQEKIIVMSNYGAIGNPVWKYTQQCFDSTNKPVTDKSRIKIPGRYIIAKMKEEILDNKTQL